MEVFMQYANLMYTYLSALLQIGSSGGGLNNIGIINTAVLTLFISVNFIKWAIFGRLEEDEVQNLRHKINYTLWEFIFGFMILFIQSYNMEESEFHLGRELFKFGGLFLCISLLKCFHYLSVYRVNIIFNSTKDMSISYPHIYLRFAFGLILLNLIDGMLITKFVHECYTSYIGTTRFHVEKNILIAIFGFEIIHISPLLILSSLNFGLNYYELVEFGPNDQFEDAKRVRWRDTKVKISHIAEFVVNLIRFIMLCLFSIIFLYFYTFPFHILPSSYLSLRALVIKTRLLLNFKKNDLLLQRLPVPDKIDMKDRCIICYDEFSSSNLESIRNLHNCSHSFHINCLKYWVCYSNNCPICRTKI